MGINLNLDYSTLFSSLSTSSSSNSANSLSSINLANYASIKNGSYYQLTKAYYAKNSAESNSSSSNSDSTATTTSIQSASDSLKDSADKLIKTGSDSLFNKKNITTKKEDGTSSTSYDYDRDAIYKAVNSYIEDYNSTVKAGAKSSSSNILRQTLNMTNNTKVYKSALSSVGITVGSDNTLSIDKDTFKNADMSTIKTLFNGNNSLAYTTSAKASQINYAASTANGIYDITGGLSSPYSSGSIYNSYF
ncbi:MAG: hypothetical protein PHS74_08555 [Lachnospiraceae bacterium]|nr:hypothetical protein [Lachnospiraceae bacterium]